MCSEILLLIDLRGRRIDNQWPVRIWMLLDISGSYWRLQPEVKHLTEEPVGAQNKEHTQAREEQEELVLLLCSEVIGPTNPKCSRCISINSPKWKWKMPAQQRTEECGINNKQCGTFCHGKSFWWPSHKSLKDNAVSIPSVLNVVLQLQHRPQPCLPTAPTQLSVARRVSVDRGEQPDSISYEQLSPSTMAGLGTVLLGLWPHDTTACPLCKALLQPSCQTLGTFCCLLVPAAGRKTGCQEDDLWGPLHPEPLRDSVLWFCKSEVPTGAACYHDHAKCDGGTLHQGSGTGLYTAMAQLRTKINPL